MLGAAPAQLFYLDDRSTFQKDIEWLAADSAPAILVSANHREVTSLTTHPALLERAQALGLRDMPYLFSQVFSLLFEPSALLYARLVRAYEPLFGELAIRGEEVEVAPAPLRKKFIGLHFRAGNHSMDRWWDPPRHHIRDVELFFACATQVERELGLPSDTVWFLSTDTPDVYELDVVIKLREQGKLVRLDDADTIVHVDRSDVQELLKGVLDAYVSYYIFSLAYAVILSRSYFGETAAEMAAMPYAYFYDGCVRADLTAS
jgi:hypothetical protein